MKARYHVFSGDVPVIFVEDAVKFINSLGVDITEDQNKPIAFMHEVSVGPLRMLVFSEALMRTLNGGVKNSVVEAHLALWSGKQKFPNDEVKAYKHALSLAERYNRGRTHNILRQKLADDHHITVEQFNSRPLNKKVSIESNLFSDK